MKKYFLIGALCLTSLGVNSAVVDLGCCKVQTVSVAYFQGDEVEYQKWIDELTDVYCGPAKRMLPNDNKQLR